MCLFVELGDWGFASRSERGFIEMRGVAAKIIICLVMASGALWVFGPREPASLQIDYSRIAIPDDVDAYLSIAEARFEDIVPGTNKRVYWFGIPGEKTRVSIVYIHGFSASSEELRPVPDLVAEALGANLYFTRLTGHGRGSVAMAEADVASWMQDVGEAMAIGRSIGEKVLVISTSTGATLAAAAALDDATMENVGGLIFVSPNFGINSQAASLLAWPFARYWLPLILGDSRNSEPRNMLHARYWTTTYPTTALLPMAALVKAVMGEDFSSVSVPALFYYSMDDLVVDPAKTAAFADQWGGAMTVVHPELGNGDDEFAHVIAGDIVSPQQTGVAVEEMLGWLSAQLGWSVSDR